MAQLTFEKCQANVATGTCLSCDKLARRVVDQTLGRLGRLGRIGTNRELSTEAVVRDVDTVVTHDFPVECFADPSLADSLSCGDRRQIVSEVAVELSTQFDDTRDLGSRG